MSLFAYERERLLCYVPDTSFVNFVAKVRKVRTRKEKDYFIMRTTVPKDVAKKIDAQPGDYLFFRVKKAEWFHMLNWENMQTTWQMLPKEIKNKAIREGLSYPGATEQMMKPREFLESIGSASPTNPLLQEQQTISSDVVYT